MDGKIKLALKQPENEKFLYQGNAIEVKPYLSKTEMDDLETAYIDSYFNSSPEDAEIFLLFGIIDLCTNIQLSEGDGETIKPAFTLDNMYAHWDLICQIRTRILNYSEFYAKLQRIVDHSIIAKNSLKSTLDDGYAKLSGLVDQVKNYMENGMPDEEYNKIKGLLDEVNASPILNEATKLFRQGESPAPEEKKPRRRKTANGK